MNIAFIGCGYVAEFYRKTLDNYSSLTLVGAYDRNQDNLELFCRRWSCPRYSSLDSVVADSSIGMVLNLTNPRSHYDVTRRCLEAGKHVYSEKPLAMDSVAARELAHLAVRKNLYLAVAPCSFLNNTAQTVAKALQDGLIGKVRLVYANFDDGMIAPQQAPWNWQNESGIPWPARDEFEVGCTYEHAGYILTWLATFFGAARSVTAFASCQIPNKGIAVDVMAPDFTVGCIEYDNNIVARVTCSLVAPTDKSLTIIGDAGILSVKDVRNDHCPVYLQLTTTRGWRGNVERIYNRISRVLGGSHQRVSWRFRQRLPLIGKPRGLVSPSKPVDFCRGPAEMVEAIHEQRACRVSAELGAHTVEIIEALQYPNRSNSCRHITSTLEPTIGDESNSHIDPNAIVTDSTKKVAELKHAR